MYSILFLGVLVIDLLIPFVIAIPYKGFSHTRQVMSVLGGAKSPWKGIYNVWMVFSGAAIAVFGLFIFTAYRDVSFSLALTLGILVILYGICDEVLSAIFPIGETKEDTSLSSKVHGAGSVIGFTALQFAPLILSILAFKSGEYAVAWSSAGFFIVSLILFVFFIMGDKPRFAGTVFALEGLWQRLLCTAMYAPFMIWLVLRLYPNE